MPDQATHRQPRVVVAPQRDALDIRTLVLLAILLAAGFILNFTVGRAISSVSGGMISPEFIISAFCLTILIVRPSVRQALVIGLISAAVIQITTTAPFVDFAAEGVAAMFMALIVRLGMGTRARQLVPALGTFVTTVVSGVIFMLIRMAMLGVVSQLAVAMLPVTLTTAVFNAVLVSALYFPICGVLSRLGGEEAEAGPEVTGQDEVVPEPTAADEVPILLDHVSFSYQTPDDPKAALALDDVSMSIGEGEFVGIVGPSGAGKSTLAAVMSGAIPHHYRGALYGAAFVGSKDTCTVSLTDISQMVGSVLQDIDTQMVASVVEDEMLFGLENFGVPHDQIEGRIAETLETVGISELRDREIATLSGGQKQKVAIAAILALRPRVVILDEPTAALDPASTELVFETLRQVRLQGVAVVVIEQKVAMLSAYCDRVLVLSEGRLLFDGTPREVFSHAEELRRLGVDSPRVTRVYNTLVGDGLAQPGSPCLNVQEAERLISGLVPTESPRANATGFEASSGSRHVVAPRPHAAEGAPVAQLTNVRFSYPNGGASVDGLDMAVYPGEVVAVVGQNGAGKTTLTKLLNGLLKPSSGQVLIAGLDTREVPTSRIAAHCATLFQDPDYQLCRDTVLEEVAFGLELQGVDTEEAHRRAAAVIARLGLPSQESPFALSRGQRQMVALASVVVVEPDVILLDEPTSGLDYRECMAVMDVVSLMADRGCAVIMVCHDMEVVSDFAERVVVMAKGRIVGRGPTQQTLADLTLMRRASVEAPQIIQLSEALARDVSPEFAGISQVSDMTQLTEEMVRHG